ncbi:MAG: hypothetical protein IKQ70_10040 [Bacteroidales bacterium]|nr:hypothetical protein [Bacteroidales bacterium]
MHKPSAAKCGGRVTYIEGVYYALFWLAETSQLSRTVMNSATINDVGL